MSIDMLTGGETGVGLRKAAILLVQLGQEKAAKILGHLRESEVEALTAEIAKLADLEQIETDAVLEEFRDIAAARVEVARGGPEFARAVLEESLGGERAEEIMSRLAAAAVGPPFEFLHKADPKRVLASIGNEHPQVIAVILAHLPSERASLVLAGLVPEVRAEVAHRIAVLDLADPDVLMVLEQTLDRRMTTLPVTSADATAAIGGVDPVVQILNRSDRTTERLIFEGLEARDPELAGVIKSLMFMFEDLLTLEDRDVQQVLRHVETADLALALKGVSEELRTKITSNMSERAAETLLEDSELLGAVPLRQVEEAQQKVIVAVRGLLESGEINLKRGDSDEYIA